MTSNAAFHASEGPMSQQTGDISMDVYPETLTGRAQWLTWKKTEGRKIPRAPFAYPNHLDRYVNAHEPEHHTTFEHAKEWVDKLPGHELAYDIRPRDEADEDLVLLDYDDVRDPDSGEVHPTVEEHISRAGTYAAVSSSGTGVHVLGLLPDGFPEGVQAIESPLDIDPDTSNPEFPHAEIEGYCEGRFVGLTGAHITSSPMDVADISAFVEHLCGEYATTHTSRGENQNREPVTSREDLADVEHTSDIQDVYDAIEQTRPRDIRLRSSVTNERPDSKDLDPSWSRSKSGTRLAELSDGWVYRQGMVGLDALQVVALEEGLITSETEYPKGQTFFRAVDALRDRGAHIPRLVSDEERDALENNASSGGGDGDGSGLDSETVLTLSGPLSLRSTRRGYTRRCPECECSVSDSDSHDSTCKLANVSMSAINTAYETIIALLDDRNRSLEALRADAPGWSPVHSQVLEYLHERGDVAPAGAGVVA